MLGQERRLQLRTGAPNVFILVLIPIVGAVLEVEAENDTNGSLGLVDDSVCFLTDLEFQVF